MITLAFAFRTQCSIMTAFQNKTICVHIEMDFLVDLLIRTSALDYLFQYDIQIDSVM